MWEASVEAVFDGKVSEQGSSNDIVYGQAMPLPVSINPTEKEQKLFTITDNNFSPGTIQYISGMLDAEHEFSGFRYASGSYPANDWLYLPLIHFDDAEAVYEFGMNIFRTNFSYDETFEVKLLTAVNPNSAVATIIPEGDVTDVNDGTNFDHRQSGWFQVPEAGDYYIGIHVTSPARKGIVWMRNSNSWRRSLTRAISFRASGSSIITRFLRVPNISPSTISLTTRWASRLMTSVSAPWAAISK